MKRVLIVALGCSILAVAYFILTKEPSQTIGQPSVKDPTPTPREGASQKSTADSVALKEAPPPTAQSEDRVKIVFPSNKTYAVEAEKRIAEYIAKGDRGVWIRMFNELLDLAVPREEAVRIARNYLNHSEPIIRYGAAETLYRIGDRGGAQALIEIALAPEPIAVPGVESDLRAWAASTLAAYREMGAADAVAALYFATKDVDIRSYAASLGSQQIIPDILADMKKRVWKNQLGQLAQLGVVEAKPVIVQQFNHENAPIEMRVAAAGAMLRFGEQEPYLSYLLDVAGRYTADNPVGGDSRLRAAGESAFRSIGLVRNDATREFLEQALDSMNTSVAQLALVQLNVNYPESIKARERLLQGLTGKSKLDAATLYRLAAMSTNEEIRTVAAQSNELLWQKAALHEREWDRDAWLRSVGAK